MDNLKYLSLKIYKNWPLSLSLAILWITTLILFLLSIQQNNGIFCYIFDDPYIHMAVAKHFAQNGVWGVTIYGFSSSTSSILWPLLLTSSYYIFGVNEITPLLLNIIFASIMLITVYFILKKRNISSVYNLIVLLLLIFLTPLPLLIFSGMEHTLHVLLSILFIYLSATILTDKTENKLNNYILVILAILLVMVRYEGIFLVFIVSILFLIRKKYFYSILLLGLSLLPVIIYGMMSIINGGFFLPNSLIIKSQFLHENYTPIRIIYELIINITRIEMPLFLLISLSIFLFMGRIIKKNNFWNFFTVLLTLFLFTAISHILLEPWSWFYRHDAYIIATGTFVISLVVYPYIKGHLSFKLDKNTLIKYAVIILLILILISPFAVRAYSTIKIPDASNSIYEQQYQMGLFLKEYYQNEPVAANDIGAINYIADIKCFDILGLGNADVAGEMKNKSLFGGYIINSASKNNVKVVIVYKYLLKRYKIPANWIKVGEWKISKKMFCANDTVSFYVIGKEEEQKLMNNLKSFSHKLPDDVQQSGKYVNQTNQA